MNGQNGRFFPKGIPKNHAIHVGCALFFLVICIIGSASTANAASTREQLDAFFHRRTDVKENIRAWSGNSDPVRILNEWIRITTERGPDYKEALYIRDLLYREQKGTEKGGPSESPASGGYFPPSRPPSSAREEERLLDPRLAQMDVRVVPVSVKSREKYWRLVEARFQSDENGESGGNHNIYVDPQFRAVVSWPEGSARVEKDFPIYAMGNAYNCKIAGPEPSDSVEGMGMMIPGDKFRKHHVNYILKFKLVTKP